MLEKHSTTRLHFQQPLATGNAVCLEQSTDVGSVHRWKQVCKQRQSRCVCVCFAEFFSFSLACLLARRLGQRRTPLPSRGCATPTLPSLHFTSQGKGPRVEDPRQGAPFPSLAEEGALGSSAVGVVPLGYSNWWRALGGTSPRP